MFEFILAFTNLFSWIYANEEKHAFQSLFSKIWIEEKKRRKVEK